MDELTFTRSLLGKAIETIAKLEEENAKLKEQLPEKKIVDAAEHLRELAKGAKR